MFEKPCQLQSYRNTLIRSNDSVPNRLVEGLEFPIFPMVLKSSPCSVLTCGYPICPDFGHPNVRILQCKCKRLVFFHILHCASTSSVDRRWPGGEISLMFIAAEPLQLLTLYKMVWTRQRPPFWGDHAPHTSEKKNWAPPQKIAHSRFQDIFKDTQVYMPHLELDLIRNVGSRGLEVSVL